MDEQAMLTRDLVLRLCDGATEFDLGWLASEDKAVAPFLAVRDLDLIRSIVAAGHKLGVHRLLICRTRSEFAYEPVTEVVADERALLEHIQSWGREPTDFLVAVEDLSAAVLVTASRLTVAAGPPDFVRELVGPDISRVRNRFAAEAREPEDEDNELVRAAVRYGCIDAGDDPPPPTADPAERLTRRRAAEVSDQSRRLTLARAVRGSVAWVLLTLVVLAAVFGSVSLLVPVAASAVWLVVQLSLLSRSRTVTFAGLLRMLVLGAACVVPVALAERGLAAALGMTPTDPYAYAYVAVPVEELGKLLPLLLVWLVAWGRWRRLAAVDYLLLAAAAGAGFWLVEQSAHIIGFQDHPGYASAPAGWLDLGLFTLLPGGVELVDAGIRFSGHAVTTALVGAAFGLAAVGARQYGRWLWLLPPAALGWAALEHMSYNAVLAGLETTAVTSTIFTVLGSGYATRWVLLLLLLTAVVLDYRMARQADAVTPRLPGRTPLAAPRRWAHGRAIRMRVRIPPDIARPFQRAAYAWARLPVTLVEALAIMCHELAVQVVAASRGPAPLVKAWRYVRLRREYAMGAARAGGRVWRRYPPRAQLRESESQLATILGVDSGPGAAAVAGVAVGLMAALGLVPAVAAEPSGGGAYVALSLEAARAWMADQSLGQQVWLVVGVAALLGFFTLGWALPGRLPRANRVVREPYRQLGVCMGALAPGQLPYGAAALLGLLLPRRVDRLLGASGQDG